jgi:hypothetical protein
VNKLQDYKIAKRFLEEADDDSFNAAFRLFSPQLVAFFGRRGLEDGGVGLLATSKETRK